MNPNTTLYTHPNGQEYELEYFYKPTTNEAKITGMYILDDDEDFKYSSLNDLGKLKYMIDIEQNFLKHKGFKLMGFDETQN